MLTQEFDAMLPANESQNIEYKLVWNDEYLKWICGFANAQGGKLYIGVDNSGHVTGINNAGELLESIPNKIVTNLGIVADVNLHTENSLDYIEIVVYPSSTPVLYHGVVHYRSGSTKQELRGTALQNFLMKKHDISWDNLVQEDATLDDISPEAIEYFQRHAIACGRMASDSYSADIELVLKNLDLITEDGRIKKAAIVLFGKKPTKFFTLCEFQIGRFVSETNVIFQTVFSGDIIRMTDDIVEELRAKYLISPIHYEGMHRVEPLEIPEDALREAIHNSLCHKDFSGPHNQMRVYNDRIELWNPGVLPNQLLPAEKVFEPHSSYPRNKNIATVFYRAGHVERWGRGMEKILDGMKSAGLPAPKVEDFCGGVKITLYRPTTYMDALKLTGKPDGTPLTSSDEKTVGKTAGKTAGKTVGKTVEKTVGKTAGKILDAIRDNPKVTQSQLAKITGLTVRGVEWNMKKLQEAKVIKRVGPAKGGHWEIIAQQEDGQDSD